SGRRDADRARVGGGGRKERGFRSDDGRLSAPPLPKSLQNGYAPSSRVNEAQRQVEVETNWRDGGLIDPERAVDSPAMALATDTPSKHAAAAPERSLTQRMDALQRANEIRSRRAQLKRDLKAGRQSIHALLL